MKKSLMIISAAALVILITIASIISLMGYFKTDVINRTEEVKAGSTVGSETYSDTNNEVVDIKDKVDIIGTKNDTLKTEEIQVLNNSPEFELKAFLCESTEKEVFLKAEYYFEGISVAKEFKETDIPEIKAIFEKRNSLEGVTKGFRIKPIILSAKNSKAYVVVEGNARPEGIETAIYLMNLKDSSIRRIAGADGDYTNMIFTKDGKYMAFSYSSGNTKSNLNIFNCLEDKPIVSNNKYSNGQIIGGNKEEGVQSYYSLMNWYSNNVIRLIETTYTTAGTGSSIKKSQSEKLLDIEKNVFLNSDGTPIISTTTGSGAQVTQKPKAESEAVKIIRNYYGYMKAEQYEKANELLDKSFKLKMNIFKQFGIEELTKSDMDVSNMSLYANIYKSARIESIIDEKTSGTTTTVYFYIVYSMGESDEIKQPLIATVKKNEKTYLITSVIEGDENEKPFKK